MWGLGSVDGVAWPDLWIFVPLVAVGLAGAVALCKPLDALLLGDDYAASMGVRVRSVRAAVMVVASVLAGVVTAYCGPIGFLGLAVPHLARVAWHLRAPGPHAGHPAVRRAGRRGVRTGQPPAGVRRGHPPQRRDLAGRRAGRDRRAAARQATVRGAGAVTGGDTAAAGLRLSGLDVGYRRRTIMSGVGAHAERGELTILIGPNGVGKSTLLRTLAGLQPALGGTVTLNGDDLPAGPPQVRARKVAVVLTERVELGLSPGGSWSRWAATRTPASPGPCAPPTGTRSTGRSTRSVRGRSPSGG